MKKIVFCLVLILSFFMFFACGSLPSVSESASASASASEPASSSAPVVSTPASPTQQAPTATSGSRATDLILDGSETYIVVRGDTLSKISQNKYRNGFYYPLIMMASSGVVKDQDLIRPGMVLTIPRLQANLDDPRARESIKRILLEAANTTERKRPKDAAGLRSLANSL